MLVVGLIVSSCFMARTFTFGASPSLLSWTVQPVLNPCPSPSCTFRVLCPSLHTLLLTQHYINSCEYYKFPAHWKPFKVLIMSPCLTPPSWLQLNHFYCVTRGRCFLFLCSWLKCLSQVEWLSVHLDVPASLCLSMNRSKKHSPGFMLCWLNQLQHTTPRHLFLGLDPN